MAKQAFLVFGDAKIKKKKKNESILAVNEM